MDNIVVQTTKKIKLKRVLRIHSGVSPTSGKFPVIRIGGEWLRWIGYESGNYVEVLINEDKSITIRPTTKEVAAQSSVDEPGKEGLVSPEDK